MTIYPTTSEGPWWQCVACQRSGDGLDWLQYRWNCDLATVCRQIQSQHPLLLGALRNYLWVRQVRLRYETAWLACLNYFSDDNTISVSGRHLTRTRKIAGQTTIRKLGEALTATLRRPGSLRYRFRGRGWSDLLIIPYCDAPGHIVGFLCAPDLDQLRQGVYVGRLPKEAGLAFLADAYAALPHAQYGQTLFITPDPTLGLSIQQQHHGDVQWPLVAGWADQYRRTNCWHLLPQQTRIYCISKPTDVLIEMAAAGDGQIATYRGLNSVSQNNLQMIFQRWSTTAVSWQNYLRQDLKLRPPQAALQRLQALQLPPSASNVLATSRRLVNGIVRPALPWGRTAYFGSTELTATTAGWRHADGRIICDCVAWLTKVVYDSYQNQVSYSGKLFWRGHSVSFHVPAAAVAKHKTDWLQPLLLQQQLGPANISHPWGRRCWSLTLQISDPQIELIQQVTGWQAANSLLVLPTWSLRTGGQIQSLLPPATVLPGHTIPPPGVLSRDMIEQLRALPKARTNVFWAVTAGVLFTALAPVLKFPAPNIAIVGDSAVRLGKATALAYSCHLPQVPGWLAYRQAPKSLPNCLQVFEDKTGLLVPLRWARAYSLAINSDWYIVQDNARQHHRARLPDSVMTAAGQLIANYLQDLATRDYRLNLSGCCWLPTPELRIFRDFSRWLSYQGGPSLESITTDKGAGARWRATDWLYQQNPTGKLQQLEYLLQQLHNSGAELTAGRHGQHVWLEQHAVNASLQQQNGIPLDTTKVTRLLEQTPDYGGIATKPAGLGWLVSKSWWQQVIGQGN